jgi:hypothetical protein
MAAMAMSSTALRTTMFPRRRVDKVRLMMRTSRFFRVMIRQCVVLAVGASPKWFA